MRCLLYSERWLELNVLKIISKFWHDLQWNFDSFLNKKLPLRLADFTVLFSISCSRWASHWQRHENNNKKKVVKLAKRLMSTQQWRSLIVQTWQVEKHERIGWSTSNESRNNFLNDIWYFVDDSRRKKCFSGSHWAWKKNIEINSNVKDFWYEKFSINLFSCLFPHLLH